MCVLLIRAADFALIRLNTSISIEPPSAFPYKIGPLRTAAFEKAQAEDEWVGLLLEAIAKEQHKKVEELTDDLKVRRAANSAEDHIEWLLSKALDITISDIRNSLAQGRPGQARDAALRGGSIIEAADLDPPFTSLDLIVKINFILIARAILDDNRVKPDVQRLAELTESTLQITPAINNDFQGPYVRSRTADSWDLFFEAKQALADQNYSEAVQKYRSCAQDSTNKWLRDLALLGEARARYWNTRSERSKKLSTETIARLKEISNELHSLSFRTDVEFYLSDLDVRFP